MRLDVATVLVQWAAGGLLGGWLTTRRRTVSSGYGWLFRSVYLVLGTGGAIVGIVGGAGSGVGALVRDGGALGMSMFAAAALCVSVVRRRIPVGDRGGFPPMLDLLAPAAGLVAVLGAASAVGGSYPLSTARLVVGAVFLGLVTDAMLLGHWYLVQPGLPRDPIKELVGLVRWVLPVEVLVLLLPTGMGSVITGKIDDGYGGLLSWIWIVSALTTLGLIVLARRALEERYYSAVMSATGLLYLAILTALGTDVLARALLAR